VGSTAPVRLIVSGEVHFPYPHKTTERGQFDRALEEAKAAGADDGLLLTSTGHVAECAIWTLFWWEGEKVATPALELGVLPGVARARLGRLLGGLRERRVGVGELRRQSLFLANAARGVVQVAALDGDPMPSDLRTVKLQEAFWP
jgi:para-aminobenzoate synthetase/4-amino-4-deoxychorismate lyase